MYAVLNDDEAWVEDGLPVISKPEKVGFYEQAMMSETLKSFF